MRLCLLVMAYLAPLFAATHAGVVRFGGLPVPGASVTASQAGVTKTVITDPQGAYTFEGLADGPVTVKVEMQLFASQSRDLTVPGPVAAWELTAVTPSFITSAPRGFSRPEVKVAKAPPATTSTPPPAPPEELAQRAADGLLINGSVSNGASSPFALLPAFGNNRRGQRSLYNGNFGFIANNSLFDARAYSLTGQSTPKPDYNRLQALFSFGGPIKIPGLIRRNGPNFTLNYQWTRNSNASTQTALMPTAAQRAGDFAGASILDPLTGTPFAGGRIPPSRISPQARVLLELYPLPNFSANSRYNYQVPLVSGLHQDDLQTRMFKQKGRNYFAGNFAYQSTRTDTPDIFGQLETGNVKGINAGLTYRRTFNPRTFVNVGVQFSRLRTEVTPFYANSRNVSGEAGITGNNQEPVNWGPPNLSFASGIASLTQPQASLLRNQTVGVSSDAFFNRGRHNVTLGMIFRAQQFNVLGQQDARGTFSFTGAAAGNDLAGFLLGIPDASSIAFGNADKYLRGRIHEAFINDDWRVNPGLTINAGVRWEYWSPVSEKYGRLINLDVGPAFSSATPERTQMEPDRNNFAPRVAFSWRPIPASSMVVRGGYGVYYDTGIYQPIAMLMSQQAPLSTSLRIANSPATPLTLGNGFSHSGSVTQATTFGVDSALRVGYSQNWQLSIQRDLPAGLVVMAKYDGGKGTRLQQQFLPNTFPDTAYEPSGFTYLTSNGNSTRHAGQLHIRRRLRSGLMASLQYTYAKSLDNASLGGRLIAQNWLDLDAERARSNFDQRHSLSASAQYTTGMGMRGGTLLNGWRGALLKEWTFGTQITAGSGLPLTPVYFQVVRGTGVTGSVRPDYSGAAVYDAPAGFFVNPAAFTPPMAGRWGNAGRNSITGPSQFAMSASIGRTFRSSERVSFDFRVDATNALNSVRYTAWNTVVGNAQFGLPTAVNPMRSVQATFRTRF
jgi:trimeric autotransporter adhesin